MATPATTQKRRRVEIPFQRVILCRNVSRCATIVLQLAERVKIDVHAFWLVPLSAIRRISWDATDAAIKAMHIGEWGNKQFGARPWHELTGDSQCFIWVEYRVYCPGKTAADHWPGARRTCAAILKTSLLHNVAARCNMMCCDRAGYPGRWRMRGFSANPEVLWEIFGPEGQFEALKVRGTFARCNDKCDVCLKRARTVELQATLHSVSHHAALLGQVWDKFGMDKKEKIELDARAADIIKQLGALRAGAGKLLSVASGLRGMGPAPMLYS